MPTTKTQRNAALSDSYAELWDELFGRYGGRGKSAGAVAAMLLFAGLPEEERHAFVKLVMQSETLNIPAPQELVDRARAGALRFQVRRISQMKAVPSTG